MAEISGVDLFGDPISPVRDERGRPAHAWSLENSNKVLIAFARGLSVKDAATAIGVSVPTLRKHYSSEVAKRTAARLRMEMMQLSRLNDGAAAGNVAAEKELLKRMDRARLDELSERVSQHARPPKAPALGKKEQALLDAAEVQGRYEPPAPPLGRMN